MRSSPTLSLLARPGNVGIATRKVAILVDHGVDGEAALAMHEALAAAGAVPRFVGVKLGTVASAGGEALDVEISMETAPSVLWDAVRTRPQSGAWRDFPRSLRKRSHHSASR